jgi:malate dehydrogenase
LSLLLKTSPLITELALYDVVNTPGVAADLSHISSVAVRIHIKIRKTRAYYGHRKSLAIFPRTMVPSSPSRTQTSLSSPLESPVCIKCFESYRKELIAEYRQARNDP